MTLHVFSSRISYDGPDRLDVTRKSDDRWGLPFAPSWGILSPALAARRRVEDLDKRAELHASLGLPRLRLVQYLLEATGIEWDAWERYVPAYIAEMRRSYVREREAWDALLARERVVLVCYCTAPARCHRAILREQILPKLGAVDIGEVEA